MTARQLPETDYLRLKSLYRRLVKLAGGYCAAAELTRVNKTVLHDYGSPDRTAFPPADVLADLETEVGEPLVSRELVRLTAETNIAPAPMREADILPEGARKSVRTGDWHAAALRVSEDGQVDDDELDELIDKQQNAMLAEIKLHDRLCQLRQSRKGCARIDGRKAS